MSNFICGSVFLNSEGEKEILLIRDSVISCCIDLGIGVHFADKIFSEGEYTIVKFQLSDSFDVLYCEHFMEPIIYTLYGKPEVDLLSRDLDTLQCLIKKIFCFDNVDKVELYFSFIEVESWEYKKYQTNIDTMRSVILSEYLKSVQVPVIKVIINKE